MKKHQLGAWCLGLSLSLSLLAPAYAYESFDDMPDLSAYETRVMVDGAYISGPDPIIRGSEADLPLRAILEAADYTVDWDTAKRSAVVTAPEGTVYTVQADRGTVCKDGAEIDRDANAGIHGGSLFVSEETFAHMTGLTVQWDRATNTAVVVTATPDDNLYIYDLGEGKLQNPSRPDTVYSMQGIIGVPEGKKRPVAVILHGSHPIARSSENRYDLGFAYLVNALADAGYLAISMNVGMNYSFEDGEPSGNSRTIQIARQQLGEVEKAINGQDTAFPVDLTGKGDLSQVVLIGHSRGGCDVFSVAQELSDEIDVQGILSLAPAKTVPVEQGVPDFPVSIIIPEYDGDVTMLDGATMFEEIRGNQTKDMELIYLESGNHGGFSTAMVRHDPFAKPGTLDKIMAPARQQEFLRRYALDFMASVTEKGTTPLAQNTALPDRLYDYPVVIRTYHNNKILYSAQENAAEGVSTNQAVCTAVSASYTPQATSGTFNLPGSFLDYGLLRVEWKQPGASVTLPLKGGASGSTLQIDLAQDSSEAINKNRDLALTVTVRDRSGNAASVDFPAGTAPLRHQDGKIESYENFDGSKSYYYSTFTPLGSLVIPKEQLPGVDFGQLSTVTLTFADESGSIMVREIALQ